MDRNPIESGVELTGKLLRDALDAAAAQPIGGMGINVTGAAWGGSPVISLAKPMPRILQARRVRLDHESATSIATNQWSYPWVEVAKADAGIDGWIEVTDGMTSDDLGEAFNLAEVDNGAAGVQGNGVDAANIPDGFSIRPAAGVVTIYQVEVPATDSAGSDFDVEWWFDARNGIDGACVTVLAPSLVGGDWQFELSADAGDLSPYWAGDVALYDVVASGGKNVDGVLRVAPAAGVGTTADLLGPIAEIGVREGERHRVTAQVKADGTGAAVRLIAVLYDSAGAVDTTELGTETTPGGSWEEIVLEFVVPAGVATARVGIRHDPSVAAGPATLVDDIAWATYVEAAEVEFDADAGGDWSPLPGNVHDALDQTDARLGAIESDYLAESGAASIGANELAIGTATARSLRSSGVTLDPSTLDLATLRHLVMTGDLTVGGLVDGVDIAALGRLLLVQLGENSASSGTNRYLYPSNVTGTGVEGKCVRMPAAGSVVAARLKCDVTAYTSGDIRFDVRQWTGGAEAALITGGTFSLSGAADNVEKAETYTAGTYTFAAGDKLTMRRVIDSGGCTTDEHVGELLVLLDDTDWKGA